MSKRVKKAVALSVLALLVLGVGWIALNQAPRTPRVFRAVSTDVPGLIETRLGRVPTYPLKGFLSFGPFAEFGVWGASDEHGWHYAQPVRSGLRWRVWCNGRVGPVYERFGMIHFSPDGSHIAYEVDQGGNVVMVVDGREVTVYGEVDNVPVFSADGKHLAFSAIHNVGGSPAASSYTTDGSYLVVDWHRKVWVPNPGAIGEIVLSAHGRHVAYVVYTAGPTEREAGKWHVVVDGRAGPGYDEEIDNLRISPDGRHVAYMVHKGEKAAVLHDGRQVRGYESCYPESLVMSPDGRHVAYVVHKGDRDAVVLDGREGREYYEVAAVGPEAPLVFSPDSKHLAYAACLREGPDARWVVVVDGWEGPACLRTWDPVFSPDSKHFAYCAEVGGPGGGVDKHCAIVDGNARLAYDEVRHITFSPDNRHIAYAAEKDGKWRVVLDGHESPPYGSIVDGGPSFRPDGTLEFLAVKHRNFLARTYYRETWSPGHWKGVAARSAPGGRAGAGQRTAVCLSGDLRAREVRSDAATHRRTYARACPGGGPMPRRSRV